MGDLTIREAEQLLAEFGGTVASRDERVRAAYRNGVRKKRIHELTGLARTTIDRILAALPEDVPQCARADEDRPNGLRSLPVP